MPRGIAREWLAKIAQPGVRLRAERLYQQLDLLQPVRQEARRDLLQESRKHEAVKRLRQIPAIRPDSCRLAGCLAADTSSFPHQAPAVEEARVVSPSPRRTTAARALCPRKDPTQPGAHHGARSE